jgi:hypothetical protein
VTGMLDIEYALNWISFHRILISSTHITDELYKDK